MLRFASIFIASVAATVAAKPPALERLEPDKAADGDKSTLAWYDARLLPVEGKGWTDTAEFWHRLPARAKGVVRDPVWTLSTNTAGICVRFVTDAPKIAARWTVTSSNLAMPHMPATGVSGLDLYVRHEGQWRWTGAGRPGSTSSSEAVLVDNVPAGTHEYMLYLPLYNGVKSLEIGIPPTAQLFKPAPRAAKPVVVYGTSICQGGCASRPGMAHVAILGRRLDVPTINLGFSGNGKMEPEMADLLAELDPAVYVLDCLPNMTAEMVRERIEPFVRTLRKAHPHTPIVLVEQAPHQAARFLPSARERVDRKNAELRATFERLSDANVPQLTLVPGDRLLGVDDDATVDGTHATDLGFVRMADELEPVLRKLLK
ncbi:MAG TPA: SGNH/GDSL hydrolase family protein [Phycisphaerae bacterium]|nr:SGNH/GDSL hydrolase family protein [Phycisphaerae bacterium]HOJ72571.1 SGNH/GDSL hydrolase family protein [Phycisphaerae bacterium]HOM49768.1 SGNH/GDSL hydrolase family protein [Phycisphaerae bacterium]HON66767.1 SGNH/GDSL hydrolase family protein [Phycisphaerae bacterium]HOQ85524.1 SGNH/GDSL hydrolase family protein [Phycisphaerae bacterium]